MQSLEEWRDGYTCKVKHRAFTLVELIVVVAIIVILAAILYPVFARYDYPDRKSSCTSNLKQLALGMKQYIQDYDEKYPPTENALGGWGTLIFPYVKSDAIFQCPSDKNRADKTTDYFINARLASVQEKKLNSPSLTILMGDGKGDQTLNYHLSQLPDAWRTDEKSPAWRHLERANYLFADGHVKWFKPKQITLNPSSKKQPTFLVK